MKKQIALVLVVALSLVGCAKKEPEKAIDKTEIVQARQLLSAGKDALQQGDVASAVKDFASAIRVAPDYFESYYILSETLIRLKQFSQAEALLLAAVKKFPDNGLAFYLLSVAQQSAGNTIPAIVSARKSVELFNLQGDKEGQQRAMLLMAALVAEAKRLSEDSVSKKAPGQAGQPETMQTPDSPKQEEVVVQ